MQEKVGRMCLLEMYLQEGREMEGRKEKIRVNVQGDAELEAVKSEV